MEIIGHSDRWHPRSGKGCGDNLLDILALDRSDRDDFHTENRGEFFDIDLDTPFRGFVHHVQNHDKGFFEFCYLEKEVEIPFEVSCIEDGDEPLDIFLQDEIPDCLLLGGSPFQGVDSRKVDEFDTLPFVTKGTHEEINGRPGVIADIDADPCQLVEYE